MWRDCLQTEHTKARHPLEPQPRPRGAQRCSTLAPRINSTVAAERRRVRCVGYRGTKPRRIELVTSPDVVKPRPHGR